MGFLKFLSGIGGKRKQTIYIVSGLPRSGTSMMMKMIEAGGIRAFTDNIRVPDENNPKGYYEFERVKKLAADNSWVSEARGQVLKVISMLLEHLPSAFEYKVIFMLRDMEEVLASQAAMLHRSGKETGPVSDDALSEKFTRHLEHIREWLKRQPNMTVLYVNYNTLLQSPEDSVENLIKFTDQPLKSEKMLEIIDPDLYRQRKS